MATTVDTLLVRIEADMADLKRDLDRVAKQSESVGERMKRAFRGVGAALAAVGGAAAMGGFIKASVETGMSIENLRVQMNALLGSVDEGGKAFDQMTKFAAGVPFSLGQIQSGSGSLAAAANNADELRELMQITGNIAAQFGIPFEMAAENVQRALSAGAASADLFQQKGVNAFMGFEAGVSYSAGETAKVLQDTFGTGGTSDGAMAEFAKTTQGALSMFQDAMFKMRGEFAESGLNEGFVKIVQALQNLTIAFIPVIRDLGALANAIASVIAPAINMLADNIFLVQAAVIALGAKLVLGKVALAAYAGMSSIVSASMAALQMHTVTAVSRLTFMQKAVVVLTFNLATLGVALKSVGKLMLRFLPLAIFAGVSWLISKFLELKNNAGSFAGAMALLKDVFNGAMQLMMHEIDNFDQNWELFSMKMERGWLEVVSNMQSVWGMFMLDVAQSLNNVPGMNKIADQFRSLGEQSLTDAFDAQTEASVLDGAIARLQKRISDMRDEAAVPLQEALELLKEIMNDDTSEEAQEVSLGAVSIAMDNLKDKTKSLASNMQVMLDGVMQVGDGVVSSFRDMLDGASFSMSSLTDLVKTAVKDMIAQLFRLMVVNNAINAMFGGQTGFTKLNAIPLFPSTPAQAGGGTLQRGVPTLVGERGPELIVPNGASTILNGQNTRGALGGGVGTVVNQTINIETGVAQTVKAEMLTMLPQFKKDTMAAVLDAKRRGGTYGRGFA